MAEEIAKKWHQCLKSSCADVNDVQEVCACVVVGRSLARWKGEESEM